VLALIQAINSCSSLKQLTLEFRDLIPFEWGQLLQLSILDQLEQFNFAGDAEFCALMEQIVQTESTAATTRFGLGKLAETDEKSLDELLELDPKLASKFHHLNVHFSYSQLDKNQLDRLVDRFQSLECICLHEKLIRGPVPLSQLANSLSYLRNLSHLILNSPSYRLHLSAAIS